VLPLLIFAQSARLLAQSAIQAGHTVWVADCFLDVDTVADRKCLLPPLATVSTRQVRQLLVELTQGEDCLLIYGSGIEFYPQLLSMLPKHISICGNSAQAVSVCNSPELFFKLLTQLKIIYPNSYFEQPKQLSEEYLVKPKISLGGRVIEDYHQQTLNKNHFLQQKVIGQAGSVLFIASSSGVKILSINKQITAENSYLLTGIEAPFQLSTTNQIKLKSSLLAINRSINLRGINSLDFMIDERDTLFILELNPRPSASMALIHHDQKQQLIDMHIQASMHDLLIDGDYFPVKHYSAFYYLFAPKRIYITPDIDWPEYCADIPPAGTIIEKKQPLCSIIIRTNNEKEGLKLRRKYEQKILALFS
jgi:predicted ATP-grasp superfamily ATP-dependent carboligase